MGRKIIMKKISLAVAILLVAIAGPAYGRQYVYTIDPGHADIVFSISHLGFSKTFGRFNTVSGQIIVDEETPARSSVLVIIDATSIDTNHSARDRHIRSPEFLDVKKYPEIRFQSRQLRMTGPTKALVTGDFTMHGVTKTIALPVRLSKIGEHPIAKGTLVAGFSSMVTINRSEYGVRSFSPAIGEEIDIFIEVEATRKK